MTEQKRKIIDEIISNASDIAINLMSEFTVKIAAQQAEIKKQHEEMAKKAQE